MSITRNVRYDKTSFFHHTNCPLRLGALFSDMYMGVHEITVVEKIRTIITEVVAIVAEISGADEESLMAQIIADSRKLAALKAYAEAA